MAKKSNGNNGSGSKKGNSGSGVSKAVNISGRASKTGAAGTRGSGTGVRPTKKDKN